MHFDAAHDAYYVAQGVTCVRDAGGEQVRLLAERLPDARDRTPGPALVTAGAVLDGDPPATPRAGIVRNADQARQLVALLAENGVDFVSIHLNLSPEAFEAIAQSAHELGLWVWGPRPAQVTFDAALEAGQDGFFGLDALLPAGAAWHGSGDELEAALGDRARRLAEAEVGVVPLLAASSVRLEVPTDAAHERLAGLDADYEVWWRGEWEARRQLLENEDVLAPARTALERQSRFAAELVALGVDVVPGSAAPNPWLFPGAGLHEELARWKAAGFANDWILARTTREAARVIGQETERGQLTVGRVGDLVVVPRDPLEDLKVLRDPEMVVVRGRVLDRVDLDDLVKTAKLEAAERRTERAQSLVVEPPELPPGHVVLTGRVHTTALERTVTAERFAVVRTDEGSIVYVSRIVYPSEEGISRELSVSQTIGANGRLQGFEVQLTSGDDILTADGLFVAGSFRIRRRLNSAPVQIDSTRERVRAIDVGSATIALALGQLEEAREFPIMVFGETLEPQVANWAMERDPRGVWQVRTHRGQMAFQLDEFGAPAQVQVAEGRVLRTTLLDERDALGGAGLPPPNAELVPPTETDSDDDAPIEEEENGGEENGEGAGDGSDGDR